MRRRGGLAMASLGMTACFLGGCLGGVVPPTVRQSRAAPPSHNQQEASESTGPSQLAQAPRSTANSPTKEIGVSPVAGGTGVSPVAAELRIPEDAPPPPPADPPAPHSDITHPSSPRCDAPTVKALRSLLEHRPEEEVREALKTYSDAATRQTQRGLLDCVAQLEQSGGIERLSPRQLAVWIDRLNALTIPLRPRAQLTLERMCFCKCIESFGKYRMCDVTPPIFQAGEEVRVYLQVRNFGSRPINGGCKTVLRGRLEIYDETNPQNPGFIKDIEPPPDLSHTPRQDFFVNIRFHVPLSCPPGSYTLWVTVEDWTDAAPAAKKVAVSRRDRKSLDFRVGGSVRRPLRGRRTGANGRILGTLSK